MIKTQLLKDGTKINNPCPKCGNTGIVLNEVGPASAQWWEELCHFCEHKPERETRNSGNPTWR